MEQSLRPPPETLNALVDESRPETSYELMLVVHVLPDTKEFIRSISEYVPVDVVLPIPYSRDPEVLEALDDTYEIVESDSIPELRENIRSRIQSYTGEDEVIVIEIGGYCADLLADLDTAPIAGIVEDTNNGHWAYEENSPPVPVVSVAQGKGKQIENRQVGPAVAFSTERILRNELDRTLQNMRVLVAGYGNIGESTAAAFRGRRAMTTVYDVDPHRMIAAELDGHAVGSREQLLSDADVVVGTTGQESVSGDDIAALSGETILVSGSSKRREFDIDGIEAWASTVDREGTVTRYADGDDSILLLNGGAPVNFRDNSVSIGVLDLIFSEIFKAVQMIVRGDARDGLGGLDEELAKEVGREWLRNHATEL